MDTVVTGEEPQAATRAGAVVSAGDVTRRFGEGETAVDALRGVSLDIPAGPLTAVMGPSGLRQVDPHAHPRRARSCRPPATVAIDGTDITSLGRPAADAASPRARRVHLPVLQPASDAQRRGEHHAAARSRGRQARQGLARRDRRQGRARRPARHRPSELSGGQQQRVAIARALDLHARPSCSRTSRPATSTRRRARRSSTSFATPSTRTARRR